MGRKIVFRTPLTSVVYNATYWWEQPGTIREENNAVYKYVGFSGTTAIAVGDVCCYLAAASDGNQYLVDGANTAFGAGVAMAAVTSGSAASGAIVYAQGWIQIKGLAVVSTTVAGSPAVGDELTTSGETAPACGKKTAANMQAIGNLYLASSKQIVANFPY